MEPVQVFDGGGDDPDEADRQIQAAIDAIDGISPVKPKVKTGYILREGDTRPKCEKCGSSQRWKRYWWTLWLIVKEPTGCIKMSCENYYDRYREVGFGGL